MTLPFGSTYRVVVVGAGGAVGSVTLKCSRTRYGTENDPLASAVIFELVIEIELMAVPMSQAAMPANTASLVHMITPRSAPGGKPVPLTVTSWPSTRSRFGEMVIGRRIDALPSYGAAALISCGTASSASSS